jgi:hypothetical protein
MCIGEKCEILDQQIPKNSNNDTTNEQIERPKRRWGGHGRGWGWGGHGRGWGWGGYGRGWGGYYGYYPYYYYPYLYGK